MTMSTLITSRGLSWVSYYIPSLSHTVWYRCRFEYLCYLPGHPGRRGSSIGVSVTHCFHDTTRSNAKETFHTWDNQFLLSKVTAPMPVDINICYQMSSTVILPYFNFANEEFSVNFSIYNDTEFLLSSAVCHIFIYIFSIFWNVEALL